MINGHVLFLWMGLLALFAVVVQEVYDNVIKSYLNPNKGLFEDNKGKRR